MKVKSWFRPKYKAVTRERYRRKTGKKWNFKKRGY